MKRVLIATDGFPPRWDGIARFMTEIIPRLQDKYALTVIAPGNDEKSDFKAEIIRFPKTKLQLGDYNPSKVHWRVLSSKIKQSDIVFVQSFGFIGIAATVLGKLHGKPMVFYAHLIEWELFPKSYGKEFLKPFVHSFSRVLGRLLYNRFDVVIVPSLEVVEKLTWLGVASKKRIVHLGIDSKKFKPADKIQAQKKLGIEGPIVGYVGRLAYEKDLRTIYRAFVRLRNKRPRTKLLIVGEGREDIKSFLQGKKNVILAGSQDNVVKYYQAMDIYVLASQTETTSLTTLEAMSCGITPVVTRVGYMKEYIDDGVNGYFFPLKDSYMLFKKLDLLLSNKSSLQKTGAAARSTVLNRFTWVKTVEQIIQILDSL